MNNLFLYFQNPYIVKHYTIIIILLPIIAAVISYATGFLFKKYHIEISLTAIIFTLFFSLLQGLHVLKNGDISYIPGNWSNNWKIEFVVDHFNAIICMLIPALSLIVLIYSIKYIPHAIKNKGRVILYYPLFLLIVGAMEGFILAGDLFTMFMFLSTFSLSCYTLVVVSGDKNSVIAGIKYLLMGAIASVFFLHGIAFIYAATGTLNMHQLAIFFTDWNGEIISAIGLVLLILGFALKMALFPMHTWLPDAHSYAPSSVSAILSGLVIEMGCFGIIRVVYYIYGFKNIVAYFSIDTIILVLASIAIIFGAIGAYLQTNIKTVLAYSSISQMGYIALGIGLGTQYGMIGSVLHIINHAIMKAALFLCVGNFIMQTGTQDIYKLRGIGEKMPGTVGAFMLAGISIVGLPPTSGFMSKWYLCLGAMQADKPFFAIIILVGSLLSALYYIKLFNELYFKPAEKENNFKEAGKGLLIPVWVLSISSVLLGLAVDIPLLWIETAINKII